MIQGSADFLATVIERVRDADTHGLASDAGQEVLGGLSGSKTVGVLQRLTDLFSDDPRACYLEIGVFQGLTLLSVAINQPGFPCFGIDNFSLLDPDGKNLGIVRERTAKLGLDNATLINMDYEDALESLEDHIGNRKIGVYFVDGAHDYRSQLMGLMLAFPYLHDNAVILIDDANYDFVRQSTRDFLLTHPEYKMVFEGYSPAHPANMAPEILAEWETGWLNGINILVRDPEGHLPVMLPPTERDRTLYVNEWLVHRHGLAELAPEALALAQTAIAGADETEARTRLIHRHGELVSHMEGRFPDRNTYSASLTEGRFNRLP